MRHRRGGRVFLSLVCAALHLGPAARADTVEFNVDRPGLDYNSFDLQDPKDCQLTCKIERRCRAWTWVKAGIQGPNPRCWLKEAVPASRGSECCISGVIDATQ